ncbi:hypothetical protein SASPL_146515 [Salvia splendens]|uniref:GAG-pre-integrase domain-containing protein n=1 Tax=Salvia splendens TaxID=180675 RepID=A0A8X8WCV9_SALSN|nr:hypothetical protein SASPL_146515 [Salvia splendens]
MSPERFREAMRALLNNLSRRAAGGSSTIKVAADYTTGPDYQTTFEIPRCCDGKRGARVLRPSCYVRFESTPFYNETRLRELEFVPPPPLTPSESKGLVVMMRDGILKATSGALVMLKGVRKNNLYYYQGSTVVGTVATATSSNKKDAEATKLWHLRLGHAGERSLQILAKQGLFKATDYDSLRIFGSIAYYHVTESKLDPRAKKALFMGFSAGVKGYRLWCLESKKTIVSRDVTFDESSMLNKVNLNSSDTSQQVEYTPKQVEFEEAVVIPTTNTTNESPTEEEESDDEEVPPQEPSQQSEPIAVRRTRRENKKPARFADMVAYALPVVDDVP